MMFSAQHVKQNKYQTVPRVIRGTVTSQFNNKHMLQHQRGKTTKRDIGLRFAVSIRNLTLSCIVKVHEWVEGVSVWADCMHHQFSLPKCGRAPGWSMPCCYNRCPLSNCVTPEPNDSNFRRILIHACTPLSVGRAQPRLLLRKPQPLRWCSCLAIQNLVWQQKPNRLILGLVQSMIPKFGCSLI